MNRLINFARTNRVETVFLLLILLFGIFVRFYDLNHTIHFGNDEGRDALVIKNIIEDQELPLLGPAAPNNNPDFHLGPFFYYLATPFFALSNLNPVGGAYLVALLSVASVGLLYYLGRQLINKWVGLISALLMTSSYLIIKYSRWSWNPNVVPFFILLIILCLWQLDRGRDNYLILLAVASGAIIQLHGTALIVLPPFLLVYWLIFRPKIKKWYKWLIALGCFLIIVSPLLIYDLQNEMANSKGFFKVIRQSDNYTKLSLGLRIQRNWEAWRDFWYALSFGNHVHWLSAIIGLASLVWLFGNNIYNLIKRRRNFFYIIAALWLLITFFLFSFYQEQIPVHYLALVWPLPFLLLAGFINWLIRKRYLGLITLALVFLIVTANQYFTANYLIDIGYQGSRLCSHPVILREQQEAVDFIAADVNGQPFQFRSEPGGLYDKAYLYLLSLEGLSPEKQETLILYRVFNPRLLAFSADPENGRIEEIKDFGNIRVLKILND